MRAASISLHAYSVTSSYLRAQISRQDLPPRRRDVANKANATLYHKPTNVVCDIDVACKEDRAPGVIGKPRANKRKEFVGIVPRKEVVAAAVQTKSGIPH
jgi:hypothetical protein